VIASNLRQRSFGLSISLLILEGKGGLCCPAAERASDMLRLRVCFTFAFILFVLAGSGCTAAQSRIGSWNLEHLNDQHERRFPEYLRGGSKLGPRTKAEYSDLAGVVKKLGVSILVLQEIGVQESEDGQCRSQELDRLVRYLGASHWAYLVGRSGRGQNLAILFDKRRGDRATAESHLRLRRGG